MEEVLSDCQSSFNVILEVYKKATFMSIILARLTIFMVLIFTSFTLFLFMRLISVIERKLAKIKSSKFNVKFTSLNF